MIRTVMLLFLLLGALASKGGASAQDLPPLDIGYLEGRIVEINLGTNIALVQTAEGRILEATLPYGDFYNGMDMPEFRVGELVEIYFSPSAGGGRIYVVSDWVRRPALLWLLGLFFAVSVIIARGKGLRAFLATAASLAIIIMYIVPAIMDGQNPVLVSLLGIGVILILAIYFVHGFNWSTSAALFGTFFAVIVTMILGNFFADYARLTGYGSDDAMMINIIASQINLRGLLLAGLLIGALGALTDITIVQASVVRELARVNPNFTLRDLYSRGMNVGLDHIGSLVNTLVLAYTGAALPLLVLLNSNNFSIGRALNIELVATEVVHTIVGSIGLVLAVPLTTVVAAFMFKGNKLPITQQELELGHSHSLSGSEALAFQRARQLEMLEPISEEIAQEELRRRSAQQGQG